jgi:hypothetical protein
MSPDPEATDPSAGGERRRLDRAPGERYATTPPASAAPASATKAGGGVRWIVAAVIVADVGALAFFVLGLLDLDIALVLVAAFLGWAVAIALVYRGREAAIHGQQARMATAVFLAGWAVVGGMLLDWLYGLTQGGVMSPLPYWADRYGLVVLAALAAAGIVAAYRAR